MLYVETHYIPTANLEYDNPWRAILLDMDDEGISTVVGYFGAESIVHLAWLVKEHTVEHIDHVRNHLGDIEECGCLSLAECMELTYVTMDG